MRRLAIPAVIASFVAVSAWLFVAAMRLRTDGHLSLPFDDGYIYLQYARRLAEGHPFSYTQGALPSTGATSWLHTMLLSVTFLLGVDGEQAVWGSVLLGAVYLFSAIWLSVALAQSIVRGPSARWWALGAGAVVACNWTFLSCAFSGMETVLYTAALLLIALGVSRDARTPWWAWLAAGLLSWVRPEGLLMGALGMLAFRIRDPAPGARPVGLGTRLRAMAPWILVACLPIALGWIITGTPTTDTFAVKGVFAVPWSAGRSNLLAERPENWLRQIGWLVTNFRVAEQEPPIRLGLMIALAVATAAAAIAAIRWRLRAVIVLLALLVLGVLATSMSWWTGARYTAPYVPLFLVVATFGLSEITRIVPSRVLKGVCVAASIATAVAYVWTPLTTSLLDQYSWNCENTHNQQRKIGEWLRVNTPKDAIVAVNDAGAIAYYADRRIIDMVGLTSHGWAKTSHERPGSTFEKLENLPPEERPSFVAAYDEVFPNLFRTSLTDRLLFTADLEHNTINLSRTAYVVSTSWKRAADRRVPQLTLVDGPSGKRAIVDAINVADLDSEAAHAYRVQGMSRSFVAELPSGTETAPRLIDGGRNVAGSETFEVSVQPGRDLTIVARGVSEGGWGVPVTIDGSHVAWLKADRQPGVWVESTANIPGSEVKSDKVRITVGADDMTHQVAYYWFIQ